LVARRGTTNWKVGGYGIFPFFCPKISHMLRSSRLLLAAILCFPLAAFAQIEYPEDAFRDLRRGLDGTWFMPTDRGDRLEIWEVTNDSTLTGRAIRIKPENGDTVLLERLTLELRDTNVIYTAIVRGQNNNAPVAFNLTEIDEQGFYVFSNPKHDDPQKIKYLLLGNREMQVTTEGKRNGRTVTNEYVFEREFTPGAVEFRIKAGANFQNIRSTGNFPTDPPDFAKPAFDWQPGWELGTQIRFKGRGGFITINTEVGLVGRRAQAKSAFTVVDDTTFTEYKRDLTYNTAWLVVSVVPEISFRRDGRLSLMAGPYYGRLVSARGKGIDLPGNENKLFKANNDFKKNDFGLVAGFQYKLNFGKKDLGGVLGLRANFGLANLDNLYSRYCSDGNSALCNGAIGFQGATLYYSIDILKF
jgi:Outer membrane protein beta-barrel domain/Domain of unknown function (DUF6265)